MEKSPIPRTLQSYTSTAQSLLSIFNDIQLPHIRVAASCSPLWLIRSHLYTELRCRGIKQVEVDDDVPVSELSAAFPDSHGWIPKLVKITGASTVGELLERIGA